MGRVIRATDLRKVYKMLVGKPKREGLLTTRRTRLKWNWKWKSEIFAFVTNSILNAKVSQVCKSRSMMC